MFQFVALVTYVKYPNIDLIIYIWKKGIEKRKRLKLNGKFENWKQISEALFTSQGIYFTDQIIKSS